MKPKQPTLVRRVPRALAKRTSLSKRGAATQAETARFKSPRTAAAKAQMNAAIQRHFAERGAKNGTPAHKYMSAFWQRQNARTAEYIREFKPQGKPKSERNGNGTVDITALIECKRSFSRWLELFDENLGKEDVRAAVFAEARKLAKTPVEFLELYFRATGTDETVILRKIKRLKAPTKEWRAFLVRSEPTELTEFVVKCRVSRLLLVTWHSQAVDGEKVALGEHRRLPRERFGNLAIGRPRE